MTNVEVSDKAMELFNEDKIDEWVNTVAAGDITFEDMAAGYKASGKEESKAYVQSWKTAFPDMVGQCNNRIESGNTMVEECLGQEQIQENCQLLTEAKFLQLEKLLTSKIVSFMNLRMGKLNQ